MISGLASFGIGVTTTLWNVDYSNMSEYPRGISWSIYPVGIRPRTKFWIGQQTPVKSQGMNHALPVCPV